MNNNLKTAVSKYIELQKLEDQYGWLSCFDYPNEYEKMAGLQGEIRKNLETIVNEFNSPENDLSESVSCADLENILKDIAFRTDFHKDFELDEMEIYLYRNSEFADMLTGGYSEKEREIFESLYYFMDSEHRNSFLLAQEQVINNSNMYGNGSFFIEVVAS